MTSQADRPLPESAEWLAERIQHSLADELQTRKDIVEGLSKAIVRRLMVDIGGASIYLPTRYRPTAGEILAACDGCRTISEVARELGIARTTVYRAMAKK